MKNKKLSKKSFNITVLVLAILFSSIAVCAQRIIASSTVTYSNGSSGLTSTNVQGAIDELYTKYAKCTKTESFGSFACFLQFLDASDTVIADDGTADHNMRYTGKTPNNYVTFNGELWRVIGVFNNVDNGTGTKETRVKIIKAESIGNKQWHTSDVNIWKSAQLNTDLQALSYASNSMVDNAVWHLGDNGTDVTASQSYIKERETTVANGNDPTWTGKVGLMYPSDYGFASSVCKDDIALIVYNDATCTGSNWLFIGNEWLLPPTSSETAAARLVGYSGWVGYDRASISLAVRPTVYLKSNVTCKNCSDNTVGTQSNPFQLG